MRDHTTLLPRGPSLCANQRLAMSIASALRRFGTPEGQFGVSLEFSPAGQAEPHALPRPARVEMAFSGAEDAHVVLERLQAQLGEELLAGSVERILVRMGSSDMADASRESAPPPVKQALRSLQFARKSSSGEAQASLLLAILRMLDTTGGRCAEGP